MNNKRILKMEPYSEAEEYFMSAILPICKDKVVCRLGDIFGLAWNEYEITEADYDRCRQYLKEGAR